MTRMFIGLRMPRWRGRWIAFIPLLCLLASAVALLIPLGRSASAATAAQVTINANQTLGSLTSASEGLNVAIWDG
ncbi:MAG TPA: cellulose-binding protein, partial [Ktedonobacteraceae bacterium]|nr:cellulose-binding protein [Ktedonobacteraceae bacterium]